MNHKELTEYYIDYIKKYGHNSKVKELAEAKISALKNCVNKCDICRVSHVARNSVTKKEKKLIKVAAIAIEVLH